jgi:hypothetical protein
MKRHPRTALGLDRSGQRLTLIVIDGRQPEWSVGLTLPQLAKLMIEHGVHRAINLDGGGSSSFVYRPRQRPPGSAPRTNRPSDGMFRPVGNHLGVVLRPRSSVNEQATPATANQKEFDD